MPGLSSLLNLEPEQIKEMAMVDLAFRYLTESKKPYNFNELYSELSQLKGLTEVETKSLIAQIYTEINLDGRFICLGDNQWGLKRWYLVETQEESAEGALLRNKYLDDDDFDDEEDVLEDEDYGIDDIGDELDRIAKEEDEDEEEEKEFDEEIEEIDEDDDVETEVETEVEDEDLDT